MSRHQIFTEAHEIVIGVDRPLCHIFASVFDRVPDENAEDDCTEGFDPFSSFAASKVGLQSAIREVETFMQGKTKTPFKIPASMIAALEKDLNNLHNQGGDALNYGVTHEME